MTIETIGTWAGLVWNALNEVNEMSVKQLKKVTKLKDKEVFAAIGWLARENKVTIEECVEEKDFCVTLIAE